MKEYDRVYFRKTRLVSAISRLSPKVRSVLALALRHADSGFSE